ncbi:MAG: DUF4924 family protein [Bacteroidales bacterium]|nr:DUF4924 family protein [Bacteroidales bacterium]
MLTAQGKKKENIAEYLLYMWHIEDQIRAFRLDLDAIQATIIDAYQQPDEIKADIRAWYESLIDMMRREGVAEKGHLQLNTNVILELTDLHNQLLASPSASQYSLAYYNVLPLLVELRAKSGSQVAGEVETAFNLLYGVLVLKLQQKPVSEGTQAAAVKVSEWLRALAIHYKKDREEGLDPDA